MGPKIHWVENGICHRMGINCQILKFIGFADEPEVEHTNRSAMLPMQPRKHPLGATVWHETLAKARGRKE